ncbi:hypothetical protein OPV22_013855 [Ensete ventricosum]|uniref:HMA domain-containing protein n=1 Tax=Ensete ventricosum TaxID=4639 RepID=A0AAV8R1Y0_ENSVE|nr:hypothetical protein OPV22_013855 [Ensete ventricosum]
MSWNGWLTGTLTEGKPVVTAIASLDYEKSEILRVAAVVEKTASHPIAKAILDKAESLKKKKKASKSELVDLENRVGCLSSTMPTSSKQSKSVVYVGKEGEGIIGAIAISDVLRYDAKSTVSKYVSDTMD